MKSLKSSFLEDSDRCLALMQQGAALGRHQDLLGWLQGDFQHYVPHQIFIAGWGNFEEGSVQHDVVSGLSGVRSYAPGTECLPFLLSKINEQWVIGGRRPRRLDFEQFEYLLGTDSLPDSFNSAMGRMRSVWVHGLCDLRGKCDSLFMFLGADVACTPEAGGNQKEALEVLLPLIDVTLRQISQPPREQATTLVPPNPGHDETPVLSERETQIMAWVAMGKTNSEIGSILNISGFTVKNHMQRIFQKLNVLNRAQAVSKVTRVQLHA
jgi:transcriptional regulator EpsA